LCRGALAVVIDSAIAAVVKKRFILQLLLLKNPAALLKRTTPLQPNIGPCVELPMASDDRYSVSTSGATPVISPAMRSKDTGPNENPILEKSLTRSQDCTTSASSERFRVRRHTSRYVCRT
jgi:hypothetical protein